jgi:anaerobic magnesium-protoporphyrin IX monomethyl ester cyclase
VKIKFVSIEGSIIAVGFRKMASLMRSVHPDTEINFIVPTVSASVLSFLLGRCSSGVSDDDINNISQHLATADLVAFSSMTPYAELTKDLISRIRIINPRVFIVWGGIHPIMDPEDAIQHANAICTGEGEVAFEQFLSAFKEDRDYTQTKNFWFKREGRVIKNDFLPLQTQEDMDNLPLPIYADNELIFKNGVGFVPMDDSVYKEINGIAYHTVWAIGCPYKCSFCGNSKFIENDVDYKKIRHTSVSTMIAEVKQVIRKHPHVSSVTFHDDAFIGLPTAVLKEFSKQWREEINIGFSVVGALPGLVAKEKVKVLVKAGMSRIKMGIQSGSDNMLEFYKRPATVAITNRAVSIIAEFTDYMISPTYDIILDNPIETRKDVIDTLRFTYGMPRPYTLNIFSLRVLPNTELLNQFEVSNTSYMSINDKSYTLVRPTFANILIYLIDIYKMPNGIFEFLLKYVQPFGEKQREFPIVLVIVRSIYMAKRGWRHMGFLDFSNFPGLIGKLGFMFWKMGWIKRSHKNILAKSNALLS